MNDLFIKGIGLLKGLVMFIIPEITLAPDVLLNLNKYVDLFTEWVSSVNFLVPLPDIFLMIVLLLGIRIGLFGLFVVNWVVRRIADFFP